jgi:hypothetical protein
MPRRAPAAPARSWEGPARGLPLLHCASASSSAAPPRAVSSMCPNSRSGRAGRRARARRARQKGSRSRRWTRACWRALSSGSSTICPEANGCRSVTAIQPPLLSNRRLRGACRVHGRASYRASPAPARAKTGPSGARVEEGGSQGASFEGYIVRTVRREPETRSSEASPTRLRASPAACRPGDLVLSLVRRK